MKAGPLDAKRGEQLCFILFTWQGWKVRNQRSVEYSCRIGECATLKVKIASFYVIKKGKSGSCAPRGFVSFAGFQICRQLIISSQASLSVSGSGPGRRHRQAGRLAVNEACSARFCSPVRRRGSGCSCLVLIRTNYPVPCLMAFSFSKNSKITAAICIRSGQLNYNEIKDDD